MPPNPAPNSAYPGPTARDWLLLAISVAFVAGGAFILPRKPDIAITCIAFFGVCGAVAARTIVRKRRYAALRLLSVEIVGGTPIRPSRSRIAALAATLLVLGTVLFTFAPSPPIFILICFGVILAAGALLALGLLTGYLPVGFIQFDPSGLTIGQRGHAFTLPWDSVAKVQAAEFNDNPVLLLWLHDATAVLANPPNARARVIARLQSNLSWVGAHVMIISSHYDIDLPFLVTAIEGYVKNPRSRAGLGVPRLAPGPN